MQGKKLVSDSGVARRFLQQSDNSISEGNNPIETFLEFKGEYNNKKQSKKI